MGAAVQKYSYTLPELISDRIGIHLQHPLFEVRECWELLFPLASLLGNMSSARVQPYSVDKVMSRAQANGAPEPLKLELETAAQAHGVPKPLKFELP